MFTNSNLFGEEANIPAAGKAGIALLLAIVHHRPGLPEPVRWGTFAPPNQKFYAKR